MVAKALWVVANVFCMVAGASGDQDVPRVFW